jgi:hypothetical protein
MDKKVKVTNLISSRVNINIPELTIRRVWERKGVVRTIPFDQLEEAMYHPGVEALFKNGVLGIEDMEVKKALGLEPEDAKEPVNIITLNDQQRKRYLTVMPLPEFKEKIRELSRDQLNELAQFAIQNEIADFDKSEVIKKIIGTDIIECIKLNRADQETVQN